MKRNVSWGFYRVAESARSVLPPKVSIGMPAYNGGDYIEAAIKSLLAQTAGDFELIISDDASSDGTQAICEAYAALDPRIIYIRQPRNIGPGPNFMFVLKRARGPFFMWAAQDDIWAETWIATLVMNIRPSDIAVRGGLRFMVNGEIAVNRTPADYPKGSYFRIFMGTETTYNARNLYIYGLFHREALLSLDLSVLLRNGYSWDFIFVFQLTAKGDLRCIPGTYQIYRLHPQSDGSQVMAKYKSWKRLLYRVQPMSYYREYVAVSPVTVRPWIFVLIPLKHIYGQVQLWWRGFRKLVLHRENI
ncbi:MAG: hypothetical protein B7Z77_08440 [Acidocella sp. 20-58-15]|nr:MAG: hypothetical protein B7Z77_08440 [Acidocella sp. 20-58-15]